MADDNFEQTAKQLTAKVEKNESVSEELNSIPFPDRLIMARCMDEINTQNRATNDSLPDIQLTIANDGGRREHLTDMKAVTPGMIWATKTDMHDLPKTAQGGLLENLVTPVWSAIPMTVSI